MNFNYIQKIGSVILSIFFIYNSLDVKAQKHEFGWGVGLSAYSGEIVQHLDPRNFRPAGQVFYRANFSEVVSLKVAASIGILSASDSRYSNPMSDYRKASFTTVYNDVTALFEYNFLNYAYTEKSNGNHFSPYIAAGLGILNYKSTISDSEHKVNTLFQPTIPFGGGFKYRTNAHLNFNFQFILNKTFTDAIDGIYNSSNYTKSISDSHNTDWYYYTGVTVSYVFWDVYCPQP
ncbi:MAG: DUF6089 family protein [Cytophaga sp.]|uniref:type IX secretion system protein PorG n=1 Tax=Cytophaga sp. TaxID=29535 RepID=UPI003F802D0B